MKYLLPFVAVLMWAQAVGTEPSPMEAFAATAHTEWSAELARFEAGRIEVRKTSAVITAVVLEDGGKRMRGVTVDLTAGGTKDRIYLDETATERTRAAMVEISDAAARHPMNGNGCMGAREFWPLYDWPWNKYHELNVDWCGDDLVLYPRGKEGRFSFPGKTPTDLATILADALERLKQH